VAAAALVLIKPMELETSNILVMIGTFLTLYFTKVPGYAIVATGLLAGFLLDFFLL
jgi:hypothetical protein